MAEHSDLPPTGARDDSIAAALALLRQRAPAARGPVRDEVDAGVAETLQLFRRFRGLEAPGTTQHLALNVARAIQRDARRRERERTGWERITALLAGLGSSPAALAYLALVTVVLAMFVVLQTPPAAQRSELPPDVLAWNLPAAGLNGAPSGMREAASAEEARLHAAACRAALEQGNLVRRVREGMARRHDADLRQAALRAGGGDARSEAQVAALCERLAGELRPVLAMAPGAGGFGAAGLPPFSDVCLGLRALVAAGHDQASARHAALVAHGMQWLTGQLETLSGADLAAALMALLDHALAQDGDRLPDVVEHGTRLATEINTFPERLMSWTTPTAAFADAACVLDLGVGLGIDPLLVVRAREALVQHLLTRIAQGGDHANPARIALLFGFPEMQDGDTLRAQLLEVRLHPEALGEDLRSLQHLAWSLFATGHDWGRFNARLRAIAFGHDARSLHEAAALSLCLSVYYAAPEERLWRRAASDDLAPVSPVRR